MEVTEKNHDNLKKLYFLVRRFDLAGGQKPPVMLREFCVPDNCSSDVMLQYIRKGLGVMEKDIVFKLRNHSGSLIIPKGSIEANSVNTPYNVDIAKVHQTMKPKDRSIYFSEPDDVTREMLKSFNARVAQIEDKLPDLTARRAYRIEREIQDLDHRLSFLMRRLGEADKVEWQGTVKINPVW